MKRTPNAIAIDGPAGSGKSTIGKLLAEQLGYLFFDTGVLYRAVTWLALQRNIPLKDGNALADLAGQVDIDIRPPSQMDGRSCDVWIENKDISWAIREPPIDANVSVVSAHPAVRQALINQQRRIGLRGKVVMVGRDIGTVVLPEAELKIYLDASVEERARRRHAELQSRGENTPFEEILSAMRKRDQIDTSRATAPLRPARDAVILNTDQLSINQVMQLIMSHLEKIELRSGEGLNN